MNMVTKEDSIEDDSVKANLCCLEGCLATSSVGFSFFVAMPTGILLVVQSRKDSDPNLLTVGIVLIILPLIVLLIVIALCFNKKRLKGLGRNNKITSKVTYNNSSMEEPNCVKY